MSLSWMVLDFANSAQSLDKKEGALKIHLQQCFSGFRKAVLDVPNHVDDNSKFLKSR